MLITAGFGVETWNQPRNDLAALPIFEARTSTPIGLALYFFTQRTFIQGISFSGIKG